MTAPEMNADLEAPCLSSMDNDSLAQRCIVGTQSIVIPDKIDHSGSEGIARLGRLSPSSRLQRILDIKNVAKEEWREHDKKHVLLSSRLGYVAIKAAGRLKAPDTALGYASMGVLSATNSPTLTALSAVVLGAGWSRSAAGAVNYNINHNQRVYDTAAANFKGLNDNLELVLPGLNFYHKEARDLVADRPSFARIGKSLSLRARRGLVATNRITPYISAAGRAGHTPRERRKLANAISIESGAIKGAFFFGVAELINRTAENNPNFAEDVQYVVKHPVFWGASSGVMMAGEFVKNKLSARRTA